MHGRAFVLLLVGLLWAASVGWSPAAAASVGDGAEARFSLESYAGTLSASADRPGFHARHEARLTWRAGSGGGGWLSHGFLQLAATRDEGGDVAWDGAVQAGGPVLEAGLYFRRPHLTSQDPFRLLHSGTYGEERPAAVVAWSGAVGGVLHYVADAPLRRSSGVVAAGRVTHASSGLSVGLLSYRSERVEHRFVVVDRDGDLGGGLSWGAAWRQGAEVDGDGLRSVADGAAFLRSEWRAGEHSGWVRLHGTGPDFRSYAARDYPFARGKIGLEGRWQWRRSEGRLLSIYGERLQPLAPEGGAGAGAAEHVVEIGFSSMPRGRPGWRLTAEGKAKAESRADVSLEGSFVDASRRFEWIGRVRWRDGQAVFRHRLQWDGDRGRWRLLLDGEFGGWRFEGQSPADGDWGWTFVYKAPFVSGMSAPSGWWHGEIRRRFAGGGEWWLRYMEPDLGRIDVGWGRPPSLAVGWRVVF